MSSDQRHPAPYDSRRDRDRDHDRHHRRRHSSRSRSKSPQRRYQPYQHRQRSRSPKHNYRYQGHAHQPHHHRSRSPRRHPHSSFASSSSSTWRSPPAAGPHSVGALVATPAAHADVRLEPPLHIRRQRIDQQRKHRIEKTPTQAEMDVPPSDDAIASAAPASAPSSDSAPLPSYAFVTLVMLGDSYVPGALVLGHSIRSSGSRCSLVVMVSEDVSESARSDLALVFDEIINVPIIEGRAIHQEWKRYTKPNNGNGNGNANGSAQPMYQWIDKSFTKFNVLGLTKYARVCLLDADMVCVGQPDEIFSLRAPAGICSTIVGGDANNVMHGQRLSQAEVEASWRSYGMRGCLYMVEPNTAHLDLVRSTLREFGGYGERRFYIGADEKLMTDLYLDEWSHAHWSFGCNSWKCDRALIGRDPTFLHYVTDKPWRPKEVWPDTYKWSAYARDIIQRHPHIEHRFTQHFDAIKRHEQQTQKR